MVFYCFQQYFSYISSHYTCLTWVSPVLGWDSKVSCPRTFPRKNPEDPVRLEPRTPGLQVKHFITEPRRTPNDNSKKKKKKKKKKTEKKKKK